MHVLPLNVIFTVCVLGPSVEDKSLLLLVIVRKRDLYVELCFVEHFDLKAKERVRYEEFALARVFWQL